jgi:YrbI family 3-deoxy-D-manno-octulosonate 8-phosphate phosphatase
MTRYSALIPLRGGSKGILHKNIKPLAGRPLCYWSLRAACDCAAIDEVAVSTEDAAIAAVVRNLELPVRIIDRPMNLAQDHSSTEAVMLHAIQQLTGEVLVTLQATSPLTTATDLNQAIAAFEQADWDSLVTGVRQHRFFWSPEGEPLNYDPQQRPRRQDWSGSIVENGAFYLTRRDQLLATGCRLNGRIGVHAMPADTLTEIDEEADWDLAEQLLLQRLRTDAKRPRVLTCDVDGTLTDGGMYYDQHGETLKRFDTRDAHGLKRLQQAGIAVWIITRENSAVVAARMRKLGLEQQLHMGITEKWPLLQRLLAEHGIRPDEAAYMGDDDNDLACLQNVGWSACPRDAQPPVQAQCRFISPLPAGHGAVRSFCEHLLALPS